MGITVIERLLGACSFAECGLRVIGSLFCQAILWAITQLRHKLSSTGRDLLENLKVKAAGEKDDFRHVLAAGNSLQVATEA